MHSKLRRYLDPLDLELVEKACESARTALKGHHGLSSELDTDEELEASLRQELIEIAPPVAESWPHRMVVKSAISAASASSLVAQGEELRLYKGEELRLYKAKMATCSRHANAFSRGRPEIASPKPVASKPRRFCHGQIPVRYNP